MLLDQLGILKSRSCLRELLHVWVTIQRLPKYGYNTLILRHSFSVWDSVLFSVQQLCRHHFLSLMRSYRSTLNTLCRILRISGLTSNQKRISPASRSQKGIRMPSILQMRCLSKELQLSKALQTQERMMYTQSQRTNFKRDSHTKMQSDTSTRMR